MKTHCEGASMVFHMPPQAVNRYEIGYCCGCGSVCLKPIIDWVTPSEENLDTINKIFDSLHIDNDLRGLCHKLVGEARSMRKGYGECALLMRDVPNDLPPVVCLCGSTRFYKEYRKANYELSMNGHIVLSVGFFPDLEDGEHNEKRGCTPEQKVALDELHKRRIDLADWIYVLNVGGYIGDSTRGEIEYTEKLHKPVKYLEPIEKTR